MSVLSSILAMSPALDVSFCPRFSGRPDEKWCGDEAYAMPSSITRYKTWPTTRVAPTINATMPHELPRDHPNNATTAEASSVPNTNVMIFITCSLSAPPGTNVCKLNYCIH